MYVEISTVVLPEQVLDSIVQTYLCEFLIPLYSGLPPILNVE
jgi:hypothetical protein